MDGDGLGLSKRRITLSTSGVVPMMARAGEEIGVNLAVSLHAVTKEVRDEIVPINKKYGIEELLEACAAYPGANNARRITFEYVMLKDKNDSDEDARELVRLITQYQLPAKVNLIPFNPWPGAPYECSTPERIRRFSNIVFDAGISAPPVRTPRGRDIDAACGQLKTAAEKQSRAELDREAAAGHERRRLAGQLCSRTDRHRLHGDRDNDPPLLSKGSITLITPTASSRDLRAGRRQALTVRFTDRKVALRARSQPAPRRRRSLYGRAAGHRGRHDPRPARADHPGPTAGRRAATPQGDRQAAARWSSALFRRNRAAPAKRNVAHHYDLEKTSSTSPSSTMTGNIAALLHRSRQQPRAGPGRQEGAYRGQAHLKPGQRVLDIGCGWGGTALYLHQVAGVDVLGNHAVGRAAEGRPPARRGSRRRRSGQVRADRLSLGHRHLRPDRLGRHVRACRRRRITTNSSPNAASCWPRTG